MSPLQRRQFGKLVAASFTSTVVADFSSKALAQKSQVSKEIVYGVNLPSTSNSRNREDQSPLLELNSGELTVANVLSKIDLPVQSVDNPSRVPKKSRAFFGSDSDRITKAIVLADKTVLISTVSQTKNGYFNHLISAVGGPNNRQLKAKKVLDLENSNQTVESVLSLPNNQLLCLVANEGIPPFSFRTIDFRTGKILFRDELNLPPLPLNHRFANLCQDAKGNIFATEIGSEGIPFLISINLQDKAILTGKVKINILTPLKFKGQHRVNDVKDLDISSSGQLYALDSDDSGKNNAMFTVDAKTGKMELVRKFEGEKFAFSL
jgi:hypothetical protein